MKKAPYERPLAEILIFGLADIITASIPDLPIDDETPDQIGRF